MYIFFLQGTHNPCLKMLFLSECWMCNQHQTVSRNIATGDLQLLGAFLFLHRSSRLCSHAMKHPPSYCTNATIQNISCTSPSSQFSHLLPVFVREPTSVNWTRWSHLMVKVNTGWFYPKVNVERITKSLRIEVIVFFLEAETSSVERTIGSIQKVGWQKQFFTLVLAQCV